MQTKDKPEVRISQPPFHREGDAFADFILQTSDDVRFWLCKAVVARASPIFKDMFSMPRPSQGPTVTSSEDPDSEYLDGKPIVHVTEQAALIDVFMRCCYPLQRPALDALQLTEAYEMGEKYDADAVRGYVRQEVARYALQTEHCLRAYLIAYRCDMKEEMLVAAKQTLNVPKQSLLIPELPEHCYVPAIALTQLQDYRERCLAAVADMCTPKACVRFYNLEKPPMWDVTGENPYSPMDKECTCICMAKRIIETRFVAPDVPDHVEEDVNYGPVPFIVKEWFATYIWALHKSIKKDEMIIHQALLHPDALAVALQTVDNCQSCRKSAARELVACLKDIEGRIDKRTSLVSIPRRQVSYNANADFPT
ncbi:hypothetical protein EIP86_005292 [Pleurotus ostreatoroseus]|nr:hypothetical protein EIP86_005292 [Pleurotus ostreatoroseus]